MSAAMLKKEAAMLKKEAALCGRRLTNALQWLICGSIPNAPR
jgi:hypothetical protein